jgi:hypothetical protein
VEPITASAPGSPTSPLRSAIFRRRGVTKTVPEGRGGGGEGGGGGYEKFEEVNTIHKVLELELLLFEPLDIFFRREMQQVEGVEGTHFAKTEPTDEAPTHDCVGSVVQMTEQLTDFIPVAHLALWYFLIIACGSHLFTDSASNSRHKFAKEPEEKANFCVELFATYRILFGTC